MRVLVCGGRYFSNWLWLCKVLDELNPAFVIHGEAKGADQGAWIWAWVRDVPYRGYPADWGRYGYNAGPKRNLQMLLDGKPDLVVAFPGGHGTANMVKIAREAGVPVLIPTLDLELPE